MPKALQGHERLADVIGRAVHVADIATGEAEGAGLEQPAKRESVMAVRTARRDYLT